MCWLRDALGHTFVVAKVGLDDPAPAETGIVAMTPEQFAALVEAARTGGGQWVEACSR